MPFKDKQLVHPTADESAVAREAARMLNSAISNGGGSIAIAIEGEEQHYPLPFATLPALARAMEILGNGEAVIVRNANEEITTGDAAALLNVSRPYVVSLLEKGEMPYRMVGRHRRLRISDVLAYRKSMDARHDKALDELVAQAQELDMGY
jgi:excisionase family DNA binding protein